MWLVSRTLNSISLDVSRTEDSDRHFGLPGRHVEKNRTLLTYFQALCRSQKGLDLYTYVYICISVSGSS